MLNSNEAYIVCVGSEYLVSKPYDDTAYIRFSNSPYDGLPFNDFIIAQRYARIFKGVVMKHNRLTGELIGGWT